jgi:hypothetical protein
MMPVPASNDSSDETRPPAPSPQRSDYPIPSVEAEPARAENEDLAARLTVDPERDDVKG